MEIRTAIDREINPFFYSKTGKVINGLAKIAGKVLLKTNIDITGDGKDETSFSGSLDSLAFLKIKDDIIDGVKFIIFDDIERCQIEMKQLLGFINYFVEHCNCHVIIIGDETHLYKKNRAQLDEFKEKTVGREFEIKPDTDTAIDYFLSEDPISSILNSKRAFIIKCFQATGYDNLRILRQCLYDFKTQLNLVDSEPIEEDNAFLHNLLCKFIAVYAEYNNKESHEDILKLTINSQNYNFSIDEELSIKIQELNQKYSMVSQSCIYPALSNEYIKEIIQYITKGSSLKDFITDNLKNRPNDPTAWEKLLMFGNLSNKDFTSYYDEAMDALIKNKIPLPYEIGQTITCFCYLDALQIRDFKKKDIDLIKRNLKKLINNVSNIDSLYKLRFGLISGCNYLWSKEFNNSRILVDILDLIDKGFRIKAEELPDLMQQTLRTLSDNNVEELIAIDDLSCPDHSSAYKLKAVFAKEEPQELFRVINGLSNKGRNMFILFLTKHYSLNENWEDTHDFYKADIEVLKELKTNIDEEIIKTDAIDKFIYKKLSETLQRSILRCEGQAQV